MTIEFRCTNCDKLLRTPPGTEGKQAKCPDCGALMTIPATSAFSPPPREPEFRPSEPESRPREPELRPREPAFPPGPGPAAPRDSGNPFQSPSAESMQPEWGPARRGFHPTQIEIGATLDRAWQIYKANFGLLVGGGLVVLGISFGIGIVTAIFNAAVLGLDPAANDQAGKQMAFNLVEQLVGYVIQTFLWLGLTRFSLKIARNEPASIADIFSEGGRLWPAMLINIVLFLAISAGILLCVLPGIWIGLTLCMGFYMLLDQGVGVIDSLKYSAQATRGNKWVLLGLWLVSVGLMVIIGLPTCGLGMIFVYPYFMMVLTVAYLGATGQLGSVATAPAPYMTPPPAFE